MRKLSARATRLLRSATHAAALAFLFTVLSGMSGCLTEPAEPDAGAKRIRCRTDLFSVSGGDTDEPVEGPTMATSVTSDGPGFGAFYYVSNRCDENQAYASIDDVEADWLQRLRQTVAVAQNDSNSVFSLSNDWCYITESLDCSETDEDVGFCRPATQTEGASLPPCPTTDGVTLPPEDIVFRLRILCGGDDCPGENFTMPIDFGTLGLNESRDREITIQNVGTETAEVGLDGMLIPETDEYDFLVPIEDNTCHPSNDGGDGEWLSLPPGEACQFLIRFLPLTAGEHRAEVQLTAPFYITPRTFELSGVGNDG